MPTRAVTLLTLIAVGIALTSSSVQAQTRDACSGHKLLPKPRAEGSCPTVRPQVFVSPDKALRAIVLPVDVSLYAMPDMESRVVIRAADGKTLTSKDFSSPRGTNGYYVVGGKWSPDSTFFVFSMASSGGHSPWSFPTWVYGRDKDAIVSFSQMIGDKPTLSDDFSFTGPHTVTATTWEQAGSDKKVPVVVDLADAIGKVAASQQ